MGRFVISKLIVLFFLIGIQGCSWIIAFSIYGKICTCENGDYSKYKFEVYSTYETDNKLVEDNYPIDTLSISNNGKYHLKFNVASIHHVNLRLIKNDSIIDSYHFYDNVLPIMLTSRVLEITNEKRNSKRVFEGDKLDSIRNIDGFGYTISNLDF